MSVHGECITAQGPELLEQQMDLQCLPLTAASRILDSDEESPMLTGNFLLDLFGFELITLYLRC